MTGGRRRTACCKRSKRAMVCLLAGTLCNVGVAWTVAAVAPGTQFHSVTESTGAYPRWRYAKADGASWVLIESTAALEQPDARDNCGAVGLGVERQPPPHWSRPGRCRVTDLSPEAMFEISAGGVLAELATGWPMVTLRGARVRYRADDPGRMVEGVSLHGVRTAGTPSVALLPTTPVWPGFAVNAVFFGAVLFAGHAAACGVSVLRAHSRRRRGRCASCGYSLGGAGPDRRCPECGLDNDAECVSGRIGEPGGWGESVGPTASATYDACTPSEVPELAARYEEPQVDSQTTTPESRDPGATRIEGGGWCDEERFRVPETRHGDTSHRRDAPSD